jgi:hypothetical protein
MTKRLREVIREWAKEHGLVEPVHPGLEGLIDEDEITELAMKIEGMILDNYAWVLKDTHLREIPHE